MEDEHYSDKIFNEFIIDLHLIRFSRVMAAYESNWEASDW